MAARRGLGPGVPTRLEDVPRELTAGEAYEATLPYRIEGEGSVVVTEGCFSWSGEGPYCFDQLNDDRDARELTQGLLTRNPDRYTLTAFVKYTANGSEKRSNVVEAPIDVQ